VRTSIGVTLALIGLAGLSLAFAGTAPAMAQGLQSLRGGVPLDQTAPPPMVQEPATDGGRIGRSFRQQPPMIPHAIEGYDIDAKANQCLTCHDWPANEQMEAPKVSESHYVGRKGEVGQGVSRSRWFCTQCHAPQAKAEPLVPNQFKPTASR